MLRNLSYNDQKIKREVENSVGKCYGIIERFRLGGVGSKRLEIIDSSPEIAELLDRDINANVCSIEILKAGVIIRFRSILETYGLVIPFYQLVVFKGDSDRYSIHHGQHKVSVKLDAKGKAFLKRLMDLKLDISGARVDDL